MACTTRFVICSSSGHEVVSFKRVNGGSGSLGKVLVCGFFQRNKQRNFLSSGTYPVFVLDHSPTTACQKFRQPGFRCNAVIDERNSLGTGIWNSFSEFFRVAIPQEDGPLFKSAERLPGVHLHNGLNDLPLLHVCPKSLPPVHEIDSAEEVLSQLLYVGFGRISSTLDNLFSVIFSRPPALDGERLMEKVTDVKPHADAPSGPSVRCVTPEEFSGSVEAFYAWLKDRLPQGAAQLALWGTSPGTKRVANLFRELLEGEISLEDSTPPKRTVHVASVQIKNERGAMLVEAYQEMADGRVRPRNRPLSEKMRPGESVEEACLRGISEELGAMGARDRVVLRHETYQRQEEERESFSYPGLSTRYVIHTITAHVKHLPSTDFNTEEDEDCNAPVLVSAGRMVSTDCCLGKAVGVKKHFWKWIQA